MMLSRSSAHNLITEFWQTKERMRLWILRQNPYNVLGGCVEVQILVDVLFFTDKESLYYFTCATCLSWCSASEEGSSLELSAVNSSSVPFPSRRWWGFLIDLIGGGLFLRIFISVGYLNPAYIACLESLLALGQSGYQEVVTCFGLLTVRIYALCGRAVLCKHLLGVSPCHCPHVFLVIAKMEPLIR